MHMKLKIWNKPCNINSDFSGTHMEEFDDMDDEMEEENIDDDDDDKV